MADQQDASLLERADSRSSLEAPTSASRRSGPSDLKIAGFVLLVCMLIAGQGLTAYFIYDQKSQIGKLESTANLLQIKMSQTPRGGSPARTLRMPLYSAPLLTMDFSDNNGKKTSPMKKLENTAIVNLEKQVKELLQDVQLPLFNETFLANLQALKSQMQDSEWKGFESWLHNWLLFQMAQHKPAEPSPSPASASSLQTKCQLEASMGKGAKARIGYYRPQCDEQGNYLPMQCWHSTGYCWCVDKDGQEIPNTLVRGRPTCGGMPVSDRMMAMPSLARLMKDE